MKFVQHKVIHQEQTGDTIHTRLHLLLEFQPKRYLVKADIYMNAFDNQVMQISWEVNSDIYKEMILSRGVDYTEERKKALGEYVIQYIFKWANEN